MTKIEELLDDAYDDVRADVVAAVKAHPQYSQVVAALAEKAVAALITAAA
jgi:hypothetical protein